MGVISSKLRKLNKKLQSSADKLNPSWYLVYPAIIILVIEFIVGIVFGFSFLWDTTHPDYLIVARIESILPQDFKSFNTKDGKLEYNFEFWNYCEDRHVLYVSYPREIKKIGNTPFFQIGQAPLTYSISYSPSKKEGISTISVFSKETEFTISTKRSSIIDMRSDKNYVGLTKNELDIDLNTFTQNEQFLFEITPDRDGKFEFNCFSERKCKIVNITYKIIALPPSIETLILPKGMGELDSNLQINFPKPNASKVALYKINMGNGKLTEITSKIPTNHEIRTTKNKCTPNGIIYLKENRLFT